VFEALKNAFKLMSERHPCVSKFWPGPSSHRSGSVHLYFITKFLRGSVWHFHVSIKMSKENFLEKTSGPIFFKEMFFWGFWNLKRSQFGSDFC